MGTVLRALHPFIGYIGVLSDQRRSGTANSLAGSTAVSDLPSLWRLNAKAAVHVGAETRVFSAVTSVERHFSSVAIAV